MNQEIENKINAEAKRRYSADTQFAEYERETYISGAKRGYELAMDETKLHSSTIASDSFFVCRLQDKNCYDGETAWKVNDYWEIVECLLHRDNAGTEHKNFFRTKQLAEEFIRQNRPLYPAILRELAVSVCKSSDAGRLVDRINELDKYLKSIK